MREMTLRSLRIFEAAASAGSYSRGAELMGMTQSAVSQQIKLLEEEAGARLFDTAARPIQLTDAGRELLRHARLILSQVAVAADAMEAMKGRYRGRLTLGVVQPANYFAPKLLAAFRELYPDIHVRLVIEKRSALLEMLNDHRVDMAIGGYPPAQAEVEAEVFARHPHCLISPADHPLARERSISWETLKHVPFIFRETGSATRQFLEHLLQVQGIQVHVDLELQGYETVKQAVMAGLGISFMSAHVIQSELEAGTLAVLDVEGMPKWLDWCLWSRREVGGSEIRDAFRKFVLVEGMRWASCRLGMAAVAQPSLGLRVV